MGFARFNWIVALLVSPYLITIILIALISDPISGDLTRLGGHLEEHFGWNEAQYGYVKPGFKMATNLADYDKYYDVLVVGDSFSLNDKSGWQNVFNEITGLSIITFAFSGGIAPPGLDLESIVHSPQFREHPPRYLIFESVERKAVVHLKKYANYINESSKPSSRHIFEQQIRLKFSTLEMLKIERYASFKLEQRIQDSGNYVVKVMRRMFGNTEKTHTFSLARNDLFSSGRSDMLLVLDEDVDKQPLTESDEQHLGDGMHNMESLVQQNGQTKFMLLIFPDKFTTYAPYLSHSGLAVPEYIPHLAQRYNFPRVDMMFQQALRDGVKDLYLPNDTHTGYIGHRLAALALVRFYLANNDDSIK